MRYLNFNKKERIFLILYTSLLIFSSLCATNIFYKFTNIESISLDNDTKNYLNTAETFIYSLNGKNYLAEYITREKVNKIKEQIGLRDPNKNYNQIIDGYGTGFAPPTEKDYDNLVGQISILSLLPEPFLQAPTAASDLSTEIYFPIVGDQGTQGSCGAWATAYYAYGYLEAKDNGWDASSGNPDYLMSPAWTYNKLVTSDSGSWMIENGEILEEWGCATLSTMPYDETNIDNWGNESAWREAPYHRVYETYLMDFNESNPDSTIELIKSLINGGTPVTFTLDAGQFSNGLADNYIISSAEYSSLTINHAQCIVGYDDSVAEDGDTGAFRVVNSWGNYYLMDGGYYWLTYETIKEIGSTMGDWVLHLCYVEDRMDYEPDLIATWEFNPAPTRMDDIITLGVGPHDAPLEIITPLYESDLINLFPEFMALDISEFQSYYDTNNDVMFYLELGSSSTSGTISSFRIERYISGVLQEITFESLDVPKTTPGYVYGTFMDLDHELKVELEIPEDPSIYNTYIINATVINNGISDESNVEFYLYLNDLIINSTTISSLLSGENETINYIWIPTEYGTYNFTAYALPVPGESFISNNILTELITLRMTIFFENFESGLSKWDSITGLWHLTNTSSSWPNPCHSPTHSMWFGQESTGDYDTGNSEMGNLTSIPIDFSNTTDTILEFYHWKETEGDADYDLSYVHISIDGSNWDLLYDTVADVLPWENVSIDISKYAGNSSVQLRFLFDTIDGLYNDYRGWLVDDIEIWGKVSYDPPGDFILSSNAGTPDDNGAFDLSWTSAARAQNYSVYKYSSFITEINESLDLLGDGITDLFLALSGYPDGTYYFIAVAHNTYGDTLSNCIEVVVGIPPGDFILSSNAGTPNDNGAFDLSWTSADRALNYSVYQFSSYISEINGSLTLLRDGITDLSLALSGYTNGTYYFIVVARNAYGDNLSNCIEVVVEILPQPPSNFVLSSNAGTPDDNGAFDLSWTSAGGVQNYSVYEYSSYITEINGSLILLGDGITALSRALSGYTDGTYYFIVVARNAYGDTLSNCIEVVVQIPPPPGNFVLSSNAGNSDDNGAFDLSWTSAVGAVSYSVYEYSSFITEINGSLTLLGDGITALSRALSGYTDGTYYFIVVAHNAYGDTLSNCIEVVVQIPPPDPEPEPTPPFIPGYNLYVVISMICIVSIILIKKRYKLNNN